MSNGTPIIIKKKKGHEAHAHHGGSWKVAYADFVTAMMAFFLVMWILGLNQQTRAIIAGYFNDPFGKIKKEPQANSILSLPGSLNDAIAAPQMPKNSPRQKEKKQMEQMAAKVEHMIQSSLTLKGLTSSIVVKMTPEGLRIELVESKNAAFFQTGSAVLNPTALGLIHELTPVLVKSGRKMILEGHTDKRPYPSPSYTNWDLSSDRANALRRALMKDGVVPTSFLSIRAYADTKLEVPADPYDPRNRRVSILLPYDVSAKAGQLLPKEAAQDAVHSALDPGIKPDKPGSTDGDLPSNSPGPDPTN